MECRPVGGGGGGAWNAGDPLKTGAARVGHSSGVQWSVKSN